MYNVLNFSSWIQIIFICRSLICFFRRNDIWFFASICLQPITIVLSGVKNLSSQFYWLFRMIFRHCSAPHRTRTQGEGFGIWKVKRRRTRRSYLLERDGVEEGEFYGDGETHRGDGSPHLSNLSSDIGHLSKSSPLSSKPFHQHTYPATSKQTHTLETRHIHEKLFLCCTNTLEATNTDSCGGHGSPLASSHSTNTSSSTLTQLPWPKHRWTFASIYGSSRLCFALRPSDFIFSCIFLPQISQTVDDAFFTPHRSVHLSRKDAFCVYLKKFYCSIALMNFY